MGEYAKRRSDGERIKIGTCEDMYYLRADQRELVTRESGSVDPVKDAGAIRFRFPFPVEDGIAPGEFEDHGKGFGVYGIKPPTDTDHYTIQFSNQRGILVSLPCPNGKDAAPYTFHRNGYAGDVLIVQQRKIGEEWWTVCECGACGAKYRLPPDDAEALVVQLRSNADALKVSAPSTAQYTHEMADRVAAGYASLKAAAAEVAQ